MLKCIKPNLLVYEKKIFASILKSKMSAQTTTAASFDGELTILYSKLAEQHRHPAGPWNSILQKIKSLNIPTNAIIVDIASGPGEPAVTIATNMPSTVTVISTDISVDMVKIAAAKSIRISNLKAVIADVQDLSIFDTDSIDVVTCCYGFMFPEDKVKALRETYRILKPGGVLLTTYWRQVGLLKLSGDIMRAVLGKDPPHPPINPLSLKERGLFESIAKNAGWDLTKFEDIDSCYPMKLGVDSNLQYKMATLLIKSQLDELNAHDAAKRAFDQNKGKYSKVDSISGIKMSFCKFHKLFLLSKISI